MLFDFEAFGRQVYREENSMTMFLKGHLWVEHAMDETLRRHFKRPTALGDRFTFSQKARMVDAIGLASSELMSSIRIMNRDRNNAVHNLEFEMTDEDLARINQLVRKHGPGHPGPSDAETDRHKMSMAAWFFMVVTILGIDIKFEEYLATSTSDQFRVGIDEIWHGMDDKVKEEFSALASH
ncbi:hypothetical protein LEP48_01295 [Isoptericola sp. NEAU-Y5]|uniref:DUF4145 domain-containing protein n=1 Tax=Isoptericola luteus TaxID=2879484 RepID=A0ABS7ZAA7_9MICO|nr:hypothetical protein [Isoptericola sp. NEAU-Y5]MCA5891985.1 hypothetical protein [Isoptericola sp. NEAU-Y5]